MTDTPSFDDVISTVRRWYYSEIRDLAEDYARRIRAREFDSSEALIDDIQQTLDGHEFVIYTGKAQAVLLASDNDGAAKEELGEDTKLTMEQCAYFAMDADLREQLASLEIDVNDPCPEEDDEPEEPEHDRHNIIDEEE